MVKIVLNLMNIKYNDEGELKLLIIESLWWDGVFPILARTSFPRDIYNNYIRELSPINLFHITSFLHINESLYKIYQSLDMKWKMGCYLNNDRFIRDDFSILRTYNNCIHSNRDLQTTIPGGILLPYEIQFYQ
jgi:hypothetical protein